MGLEVFMDFSVVPAKEWKLDDCIGSSRKSILLSTPFTEIMESIVSQAKVTNHKWEPAKRQKGLKRVSIVLTLPATTVDLFHSGAGGYRAQYYLGVGHGNAANRYLINHLIPTLEQQHAEAAIGESDWHDINASLRHSEAKAWIYEGAWLSDNKPSDQNLSVERWHQNARKITLRHRFEPSWAKLTPQHETHLEIKGGFIHSNAEPAILQLKPRRSKELHDHGYT